MVFLKFIEFNYKMSKKVDYDFLVDQALRNVVHKVLKNLSETTTTETYQYYITFETKHPSVKIPIKLFHQYPESLTIVLEHQFWDLKVQNNKFNVTLAFKGNKLNLEIGFDAIIQFNDPSSDFSLQFSNSSKIQKNSELYTISLFCCKFTKDFIIESYKSAQGNPWQNDENSRFLYYFLCLFFRIYFILCCYNRRSFTHN